MRRKLGTVSIFSAGLIFGIFLSQIKRKSYGSILRYITEKISCVLPLKSLLNYLKNDLTPNENCVGVDSPDAGIAESCVGCPNASICASNSAKKKENYKIENLSSVKNIILILSGKGGVGKSTVSAQLSWYLSSQNLSVGLLDIDICGPSAPKMMGVQDCDVHTSATGWSPVYVSETLSVMSTAFLLSESDDAIIWRGPKKNGLIKQFLTDVVWGDLDYLIIDTPPGTSDEHLSIVSYLKGQNVNGAVIVTTPQEIALQDVRKEISFCKKVDLNIIGVVENMGKIFKNIELEASVQEMCKKMGVKYLVKIPWDEQLLYACDKGTSICGNEKDSPASIAIKELGNIIISV
ncbi:hypothetical protein FG386_001944 [Cryptosporidium ryanae]|uniref:uncharacterized protein n=1 Tax=Cryptosporidium ryanae TaxID=515981 RepID=UPI00351A5FCE|nr:hypothetical protein FG386_001944 [Cryptosporidium ryanae]